MRLTRFDTMDPYLVLGLANTALRNDADDLDDLAATHDFDPSALEAKLLKIGYRYDPTLRQFRAADLP